MSAKSRRNAAKVAAQGSKAPKGAPQAAPKGTKGSVATKEAAPPRSAPTKTKTSPAKTSNADADGIPTALASNRRMDIELLRVVAVLSVMIFHFAPGSLQLAHHGYLGVDIFFTISGFVITAQILRARDRGSFTYPTFLAGRVRRLLPSAVTVIVVTMVVLILWGNPIQARSETHAASASLLYVANFFFADQAVDYFAQGDHPSAFIHFWSLSVEEQFYIFWPLALLVIGLFTRKSSRRFLQVVGVFALVVGIISLIGATVAMQDDPTRAFFMPWWRAHQLLLGVLVAVVLHLKQPAIGRLGSAAKGSIGLIRVACVVWLVAIVLQGPLDVPSPGWQSIYVSLPVAFILATGWVSSRDLLIRLGGFRVLAWVAAVSYVLYLWHWPIWIILNDHAPAGTSGGVLIAIALVLTFVLAALTHYFVEVPIRSGKRVKNVGWQKVLIVGVGSGVALAVLFSTVGPSIAISRSNSFALKLDPPIGDARNNRPPGFTQPCFNNFNQPANFNVCVDNPTGAKKTLLIGDSHAMQWQGAMAALAPAADTSLSTTARALCPPWDVWSPRGGQDQSQHCGQWQLKLFDWLKTQKPDTIVVSSWADVPILDPRTGDVPKNDADRKIIFQQGVVRTLDKLKATGADVVVLEDVPGKDFNPIECLSDADAPTDCQFPNDHNSTQRQWLREAVRTVPGVTLADPYPLICPDAQCQVVDGNMIKYIDGLHISNTYAKRLSPWITTWWDKALGQKS